MIRMGMSYFWFTMSKNTYIDKMIKSPNFIKIHREKKNNVEMKMIISNRTIYVAKSYFNQTLC